MKREFLKELGLGGEQIEKIMAEHGKAVDKIRNDTGDMLKNLAVQRLVEDSGTVSPDVLSKLLAECSEDEAKTQISKFKSSCPWLFRQELPIFSAPCEGVEVHNDPFRYGAGLN